MPLLHIAVLALVQGITEFLPISSSAHLILVPVVFGWPDQGLLIDVAVHVGTLGAVVAYFRHDVARMLCGVVRLSAGHRDGDARLAAMIGVATIPVLLAGLALKTAYPDGVRSIAVVAWANIVFASLLYAADRFAPTRRTLHDLRLRDAVVFGLAQAAAVVPGTSRSGVTITAGRLLGFNREESARFSLLMSIPTILAAGILSAFELHGNDDARLTVDVLIAAGLAFVSALIAIWAMMAWLKHASFTPFVIYRMVLGAALFAFVYGLME
jgi:undecaprenyl-diphosphatase